MRLLLSLRTRPGTLLPAHYNYPLSAALSTLFGFNSAEFTAFLHDIGLHMQGSAYGLFTFALRFHRMQFEGHFIRMLDPFAELHFSSPPFMDDFLFSSVFGTAAQQSMYIDQAEFTIDHIAVVPPPVFSPAMRFTLLSPIVLSVHRDGMRRYYLRPHDTDEINRTLTADLVHKYEFLTGDSLPDASVELVWDKTYIRRHDRVTRRVLIEERGRMVDVIGVMAPFELRGAPELIHVGYDCGFGEKNATGFGMARAVG